MFQGRKLLAVATLSLAALVGAATQAKETQKDFPAVPGEFIVKLKNPKMLESKATLSAFNSSSVRVINKESASIVVKRPVGEAQSYSINMLNQNPLVEYAEPNYIYTFVGGSTEMPNDPRLGDLWGLINTGQKSSGDAGTISGLPGFDINAKNAWAIETGSKDVKIAVIDTGVDYTLADLAPNMWTNLAELNGEPGVDDDGNGCIDDIHGCDFANNDGDPKDDHGHGSHVAGTIAAAANNGTDIVGVAWDATIIGIKFLTGSGGGTLENAIKSIDYATAVGAHMTNNSWGGGGRSQALLESIQRAEAAGVLFVAAAGNSRVDMDRTPQYPASYEVENIISVAAVDNAGKLASFSNYGRAVHVAAPGVNVLSVTPRGLQSWSGTSMACPHVAGVAALLYSQDITQSYSAVKERILASARPVASLRGKVGTGMVDAYYALSGESPPADPNDPTGWEKLEVEGVETPHPYESDSNLEWEIEIPGAAKASVRFSKFDTENNFDVVTFYDRAGKVLGKMSGNLGDDVYSQVFATDYIKMVFTSDRSMNRFGFIVDGVHFQ